MCYNKNKKGGGAMLDLNALQGYRENTYLEAKAALEVRAALVSRLIILPVRS